MALDTIPQIVARAPAHVQAHGRLAQHPEPAPALDAVQYLWSLGFDTAEIAQMLRVHQSVICRMDYRGVRA